MSRTLQPGGWQGEKVTYLIVRYFAGIIPPLPWILVKDVLDDKRIPRISLVTKSLTILRNEVTSDSTFYISHRIIWNKD